MLVPSRLSSSTLCRSAASPKRSKIASYAQMRHLPFTAKNYSTAVSTAATLQLLYAYPMATISSSTRIPNELRDGFVRSPSSAWTMEWPSRMERPGLGIDVDEEALKRWVIRAIGALKTSRDKCRRLSAGSGR